MKDFLQTKPIIGKGIYTMPDVASILQIPYPKIQRWIKSFWNNKFGKDYEHTYSWNVDLTQAVNFFTMIEIYIFYELSQVGVSSKQIIEAHQILSKQYNTFYPFANKEVLKGIRSDGRKILFEQNDGIIYSIDKSKQTKLAFIRDFFKNLDFDTNQLAIRLWPIGKDKSIVCDPRHQFGQPIVKGTNIHSEAIYNMYKASEPTEFIASLYEITKNDVKDAIEFHSKAA